MVELKEREKTRTPRPEKTELERPAQETKTPARSLNPFEYMRRFAEEMDRLSEEYGFGLRSGWTWPSMMGRGRELLRRETGLIPAEWSPRVEVMTREGQFIVRAELPGLTREQVHVDLTGEVLTIQGERKQEKEEEKEGHYYSERSYGSFFRAIPLPENAVPAEAKATFSNGVLEVAIPAPPAKQERPEPHHVEIGEG